MDIEHFYQVKVRYEKGSFFEEDVITEHYKDYQTGKCAFEEFEKNVYQTFEDKYDSAEIIVDTDICADNVMITTIIAKNELWHSSDRCVIKFKSIDVYA